MRILVAHNRYRQRGGEDSVVETELELLKSKGHEVHFYERRNDEINKFNLFQKVQLLNNIISSQKTYQETRSIIEKFRPDIVHCHNIFYMISPSIYQACRDEGVPVVQTQHNFRLLCANGLFFRDNHVCEECLTKGVWQGVRYGCYNQSRVLTAAIVKMLSFHWQKRTWPDKVDAYIALSEFSRQKYIQAGISAKKIFVKPNFVFSGPSIQEQDEGYALYVGRLSVEKGAQVLLKAWQTVKHIPLKIIGDGPLMDQLKADVHKNGLTNIEFLGYLSNEQCQQYIRKAKFLIVPSVCYENFPRIIVEAFANGVPVVASRLGSMKEIVDNRGVGITFEAGNPSDLAERIERLNSQSAELSNMKLAARREYELKYLPERNYSLLMDIYQKVIQCYGT